MERKWPAYGNPAPCRDAATVSEGSGAAVEAVRPRVTAPPLAAPAFAWPGASPDCLFAAASLVKPAALPLLPAGFAATTAASGSTASFGNTALVVHSTGSAGASPERIAFSILRSAA